MEEYKGKDEKYMDAQVPCQVCYKKCKPLRCARCRQAWYCSRACQKKGWRAGHQALCEKLQANPGLSPKQVMAQHAMLELQTLMAKNYSLDTLSAEYHLAKDEFDRKNEETAAKEEEEEKKVENEARLKNKERTGEKSSRDSESDQPSADEPPNKPMASTKIGPKKKKKLPCEDVSRIEVSKKLYWGFWIENLRHINSYQIMLFPQAQQWQSIGSFQTLVNQLEMSVTVNEDKQSSIISLRRGGKQGNGGNYHPILYIQLPGKVNPTPSAFDIEHGPSVISDGNVNQGDSLALRLQYEPSLEQQQGLDDLGSMSLLATELDETSANELRCKFCKLPILKEEATIDRVVRMPSSNWDDIADYLICYSGQATIDFSSASTNAAQTGAVLVDTNAILLHQEDAGSSVCVLAVEGYGENDYANGVTQDSSNTPISPFAAAAAEMGNDAPAIVRGPRPWRETVGGGSICCSQCCSTLGFASLSTPDTYRFLKHRLVTKQEDDTTSASPRFAPVISCSLFVAREMIRYAETKAIFTFVVERNEPGVNGQQLLLLKLLSWDSQFATNDDVSFLEHENKSNLLQAISFHRSAKIIFEETCLADGTQGKNSEEDISSWVWGGVDLCCLPDGSSATKLPMRHEGVSNTKNPIASIETTQEQSTSSVRLLLETNEWDELRTSLQLGGQVFSKKVVEATVAAKLGRRDIPDRQGHEASIGLSVVALD